MAEQIAGVPGAQPAQRPEIKKTDLGLLKYVPGYETLSDTVGILKSRAVTIPLSAVTSSVVAHGLGSAQIALADNAPLVVCGAYVLLAGNLTRNSDKTTKEKALYWLAAVVGIVFIFWAWIPLLKRFPIGIALLSGIALTAALPPGHHNTWNGGPR